MEASSTAADDTSRIFTQLWHEVSLSARRHAEMILVDENNDSLAA
jgi:hypothetical protein